MLLTLNMMEHVICQLHHRVRVKKIGLGIWDETLIGVEIQHVRIRKASFQAPPSFLSSVYRCRARIVIEGRLRHIEDRPHLRPSAIQDHPQSSPIQDRLVDSPHQVPSSWLREQLLL